MSTIGKALRFLKYELIFNGHLQSLGAVSIVAVSSLIISYESPNIILLALVYFVFQYIYANDRYVDLEKDHESNFLRSLHLKSYLNKIPWLLVLYLSLAIFLNILLASVPITLLSIVILSLGHLYPYYFKNLTKKIPLFKNWYVAVVHGLLILYSYLLLRIVENVNYVDLSIFFVYVVAEVMIMQVFLDIKDINVDHKAGLITLPVRYGKEKALFAAKVLSFVTALILIAVYLTSFSSWLLFIPISSFIFNIISSLYINKNNINGYIVAVAKLPFWLLVLIPLLI